jgi:large subunit ribosomal protein L24e
VYPPSVRCCSHHVAQVLNFLDQKAERSFLMKRNPREVVWTVFYRRKHKKGESEEAAKRRTRRTTKLQRAIEGVTLADILAKRNQKPEVRKAMRESALREAKEKAKAKTDKKVVVTKAAARGPAQQKAAKNVKAAAPRVGGKR